MEDDCFKFFQLVKETKMSNKLETLYYIFLDILIINFNVFKIVNI